MGSSFKKVASVQVGEPPLDFKKKAQDKKLKLKQDASDAAFRIKQAEAKVKKLQEQKQREIEKARRKQERETKKKMDELQKKFKEDQAKKEGKEIPEEEKKPVEEIAESDEEFKEPEKEEKDEEPPKVELTQEEKKAWFVKAPIPDISEYVLNTTFGNFSLPDRDEGFDDISYSWSKSLKSQEYIKNWILQRKLSTKVENIQPSQWFNDRKKSWDSSFDKWKAKQQEYRNTQQRQEAAKKAKE